MFSRISSAGAPRKVLLIVRREDYRVHRVLSLSTRKEGPLLVILSGLRSPKGLKAVLHTKRTTNMANIVVDRSYISVCGPGIVHSAVKSICQVPFICMRRLPRALRVLTRTKVRSCTTRLGKGGDCSRRSCAEKATFLVKGRNGKLQSRMTSTTRYCVGVPVYKRMRSLGTTITSSILVFRTTERHQ